MWIYVVGLGGSVSTVSYLLILAIAYEVSFNNLYGPYAATARQSASQISSEFSGFLGILATFFVTFGSTRRLWLWGQTNEGLEQEEYERRQDLVLKAR